MPKVAMLSRVVAKEGRRADLLAALHAVLEVVHEEDGTELYIVHEGDADQNTVFVYELFADEAGVKAHRASAPHIRLVAQLGDLTEAPPETSRATPVGAKITQVSVP